MEKLKGLKSLLKLWNKEEFGNVGLKKTELLKAIDDLDTEEEINPLSIEKQEKRKSLKESLTETIVTEQRMWLQKGKLKWLQEGDENTNFFHRWSTHKKCKAFISEIKDDQGTLLTKGEDIEAEFVRYFSSLYTAIVDNCYLVENMDWSPLQASLSSSPEDPFTEEEIRRAVTDLGTLKSLGPDGMSNEFVKMDETFSNPIWLRCSMTFLRRG